MKYRKGEESKADIARRYRDENPEMPTLKLARIIYDENKLIFNSTEDARSRLRYIEGKFGDRYRKFADKTKYFMTEARPKNPYSLPESDAESFIPFYIKGFKRGFILNDIHLPYQDNEAITAAFNFAKKEKPDFIFINGDLLDFHQLSHFEKDPRKKSFATELSIMEQFFQILQKTFKCKIYFKFGNHEIRYQKFLRMKAKELDGVREFELTNIVRGRAEGVEIIEDKRIVLMNGLPFIHGHETGRAMFSPVNAARGLMMKAKRSSVKGDCHTTSEHNTKDLLGKFMTTWSVGCLCGLTPEWLPINEWNHGFAMVDLDSNGVDYSFRNYRITNGKVL